jgi:hypothetical protein
MLDWQFSMTKELQAHAVAATERIEQLEARFSRLEAKEQMIFAALSATNNTHQMERQRQ